MNNLIEEFETKDEEIRLDILEILKEASGIGIKEMAEMRFKRT